MRVWSRGVLSMQTLKCYKPVKNVPHGEELYKAADRNWVWLMLIQV